MKAGTLIDGVVMAEYRERAHVRCILEDDMWYHIHRDEELPKDHPIVVYVRAVEKE